MIKFSRGTYLVLYDFLCYGVFRLEAIWTGPAVEWAIKRNGNWNTCMKTAVGNLLLLFSVHRVFLSTREIGCT
jgi:hypothetical protein